MLNAPDVVRSEAKIAAVSWMADIKVVVLGELAKLTAEVVRKLVPLTVRVKAVSPVVFEVGVIEVVVGTGLPMVMMLLNAKFVPGEVAHIFILSLKEYCIDVYCITPITTEAPFPGIDVNIPEPAVPPQTCVESTAE